MPCNTYLKLFHQFRTSPLASIMLALIYICSECVYVCVSRIYTYKVYMHWKYIKHICIYLLYPFSRLYQSTISQRKDSIYFKEKLARKESKVDLIESKGHYFPECSRLFPSPYCLYQKVPGSSDFLFKTFSFTSLPHISKIPQEYDCLL